MARYRRKESYHRPSRTDVARAVTEAELGVCEPSPVQRRNAVSKIRKSGAVYARLKRLARQKGYDLDERLDETTLELAFDPDVGTSKNTQADMVKLVHNIRSAETGVYPHIAPQKTSVVVSKGLPEQVAGMDPDRIDELLDMDPVTLQKRLEAVKASGVPDEDE